MSSTHETGPRALPHRTTLQRLNAELALAALERGEGHASHRPMHVALQVASACNLDCYMCLEHTRPVAERHGKNLKSLPRPVFDAIAQELFPYSSRLSFAIGGEPTLADGIEYFLERAFESGQEIELLTNGTRLDHGDLARVVARCVAYLQISIDGATRETYERIRGGARLSRILSNIELVNRHRAAHSRDERTHVSFWVTLMRSNVHELPLLVELAARLDIDRVHAHHVTPATREAAEDSLLDHPELWNECRALAIARAHELGIEIDVPEPSPVAAAISPQNESPASVRAPAPPDAPADPRALSREHDPRYARVAGRAVACHLPGSSVYVLWDGRVVPCCYAFAMDKMTMGRLPDQSFESIWNGRLYRNLRVGMVAGDVLPVCRHCPVVHDVPVTPEGEAQMRASPTLGEWFDGRDLAGAEEQGTSVDVLARLRGTSMLAELDDLRRHARALEEERRHLVGHVANLESERPHLLGHIANMEGERPHLLGHIANLERELAALRRAPV